MLIKLVELCASTDAHIFVKIEFMNYIIAWSILCNLGQREIENMELDELIILLLCLLLLRNNTHSSFWLVVYVILICVNCNKNPNLEFRF